jgi:hypothetical protein
MAFAIKAEVSDPRSLASRMKRQPFSKSSSSARLKFHGFRKLGPCQGNAKAGTQGS